MLIYSQEIPHLGNYSTTSVLRSLLNNLDYDGNTVIGYYYFWKKSKRVKNVKYKSYGIPIFFSRGERYQRFLGIPLLLLLGIYAILKNKEKSLMVIFPDDISLFVAFLLTKIFKLDLFPYFMDLYKETKVWNPFLDKWLQDQIFLNSSKVVVINNGLKEYYKSMYNINCTTLPFSIPSKLYPIKFIPSKDNGFFNIAYSGTINEARLEGLKLLVSVLNKHSDISLSFFSPQGPEILKRLGLWNSKFSHKNISNTEELIFELSKCDLLYNPVYSGAVEIMQIKTSFGGKIAEYLASGVPILVDSQPDFFTYKFFDNEEKLGLCEHNSFDSLTKIILKLKNDENYYTKTSLQTSVHRDYFSKANVNEIFKHLI